MHDTQQLQKVLNKEPAYQGFYFKKVLGADQIPSPAQLRRHGKKWVLILNTDPIALPGQHWVLAFKPSVAHDKCFFFDSYGRNPGYYQPRLWSYLQQHCLHNTEDYQRDYSTVCGDYALFVAKWLTRESRQNFRGLDKYLDPRDDPANDEFIHKQVHSWYPKILNVEKHNEALSHPLAYHYRKQSGLGLNQGNICRAHFQLHRV